MPKKKKVVPPVPVEVPVEAVVEPVVPVEVKKVSISVVRFEGATVFAILNDGRHLDGYLHCRLSDGTTKHVPVSLFVEANIDVTQYV